MTKEEQPITRVYFSAECPKSKEVCRIVSRRRRGRCAGYTEAGKSFVGMANTSDRKGG